MRKIIVCMLAIALLAGCGSMEKIYDKENYESLSNECGVIELYSGGVMVKKFDKACITYSSADTDAIFFKVNGQDMYWQGDAFMKVN